MGDFFAGNPFTRGGVRIAVKDLNGDGFADILSGGGPGVSNTINAFSGVSIAPGSPVTTLFSFDAFSSPLSGVWVG